MSKRLLGALIAALALTFAVAACGSSSSDSSSSGSGGGQLAAGRRRQHPGRAADVEMAVRLRVQVGNHGHLRRDRQRRRDRADHLAHRRLRRLRRAADRRTVRRSRRQGEVEQIPWALSGTVPAYNVKRRAEEPQTERRSPRRHLPRQDHQLGRPGDRQAQPGRQPAEHQDHPGLPQRRQRRHLRVHQLPLDDRPRIQVEGRHLDPGQVPDRRRRRKERRRRRGDRPDRRRDRLRRARLRALQRTQHAAGRKLGRGIPRTGREERRSGRRRGQQDRPEQRNLAGRPAGLGQGRLPDLDLHLRDRAAGNRKGGRAEEVHHLRDRPEGQSYGPDLDFAPLPKQVVAAGKKAIAKIGS